MRKLMPLLTAGIAVAAVAALSGTEARALPSACDAVAGNLVQNCGFETGDFSQWTVADPVLNTGVFAGAEHTGNFGAVFYGPAALEQTLSQSFVVIPNALYSIDFWTAREFSTGNDAKVDVSFDGVPLQLIVISDSVYQHYTFLAPVGGDGTAQLSFVFLLDRPVVIDDIVVAVVPEPATLALLGAGLLGLGLRRRVKR